jgi:hypothetical protein
MSDDPLHWLHPIHHDFKLTKGRLPCAYKKLSKEETAQLFLDIANELVYRNDELNSTSIYIRIEYESDDSTRVKHFHYWVFYSGEMIKVGSGGYIPTLHPISERMHEFQITNFTRSQARLEG